jgi:tRNA pseudouridine55 synthase
MKHEQPLDGALIIDKPAGITSHYVVQRVRRLLGIRRVGHLGTLDPFATGVLVLLMGKATRLARFYGDRLKSYEGVIRFGLSTRTYDLTGEPASKENTVALDPEELRAAFRSFRGTNTQLPPPFSAKKIGGVPAYRKARRGESVELTPVDVTIYELELTRIEGMDVGFVTRVSPGTYIRSLSHDLGQKLGTGAHLTVLRRTASGEFDESMAVSLERLEELSGAGQVPVVRLVDLMPNLPSVLLSGEDADRVRNGQDLTLLERGDRVKLLNLSGQLCAIAERVESDQFHPCVVLETTENEPIIAESPSI